MQCCCLPSFFVSQHTRTPACVTSTAQVKLYWVLVLFQCPDFTVCYICLFSFGTQVMVYDEAWDTVDLEGQHDAATAAAAAAAASPPTGFRGLKEKASVMLQTVKTKAVQAKGSAVLQRAFWSRRRLLVLLLLLLAVLGLALGLGVGLGTRPAAGEKR
jgi:hypothetical protein